MRSSKIFGILVLVFSVCVALYYLYFRQTDVGFKEDTNIHINMGQDVSLVGISGVLSSQEELIQYLSNLENIHRYSIEVNSIDLFDFAHFDYIIIPGRSMVKLTAQQADECSQYDDSRRLPVIAVFEKDDSNTVHVYKIFPKNKYRYACG